MTCGIYCITNTATGDQYVGRSKDMEKRWKQHQRLMVSKQDWRYCPNPLLVKSYRRYSPKAFKFEVLEECSTVLLKQKELDWARKLQPTLNTQQPAADGSNIWKDPNHPQKIQKALQRKSGAELKAMRLRHSEVMKASWQERKAKE